MALVSMDIEPDYSEGPSRNYNCPCIYLTEEQVEALGLAANPPAAGSTVSLRAVATVVSKTEETELDGDDDVDVRLTLQITDLEVTPGGMSSSTASSMLYGD